MINVGIVGVGNISGIYLKNITGVFKELKLIGVCDLIKEKALKAQEEYPDIEVYETMYDLFADDRIQLVLNITRPHQHYDVSKAALLAGKNVYSEKPLAATVEEGKELVELAKSKGLLIGGAPDTFMGASIQTCRKFIDEGKLGEVIGGRASMLSHGHENWHPDPEFMYERGGGPMFDMGPYYVTCLINLLGKAKAVTGIAKTSFKQRVITSQPKYGKVMDVQVPTHISGFIHFENGAIVNLTTSFDVYKTENAIELYGTKGTLYVPDPNCFGNEIKYYDGETKEEIVIPVEYDYAENSRGLGLADLAKAIETGRMSRTSYNQTFHVLEIMESFVTSSELGRTVEIKSDYERQPPMDKTLPVGEL